MNGAPECAGRPFIEAFESGGVPDGGFHHRDHVRLAWSYLREIPLTEAMGRFAESLRRFAARHGKSNLYHETITCAFLILVHERMQRTPDASWEEFSRLHADLLCWKPSILDRYYHRETLASDFARRVFVLPDGGNGPAAGEVGCDRIATPGRA